MSIRRNAIATVAAVASIAAGTALLQGAFDDASRPTAAAASSRGAAAVAPAASAPEQRGISDQTIAAIKRQTRTSVRLMKTPPGKAIGLERAVAAVNENGGQPTEASIAMVTVVDQGMNLEKNPALPQRLDLTIEDREVWLMRYDNAQVPLAGPQGGGDGGSYEATLIVMVDAQTGEFLRAETL